MTQYLNPCPTVICFESSGDEKNIYHPSLVA